MILGAFLGIIATVVYYQMARCYQQYRQSCRAPGVNSDLESQRAASAVSPAPAEDPNKYIFRKTFKEDNVDQD